MAEPFAVGMDRGHLPAALVITVTGELDLVTAPALREALATGDDPPRAIVLDLSALSFCDSTGLSVMIATHNRLVASGGGLHVAGMQPRVASIVTLTELDQLFQVHPDVEAALGAVVGA